MPSKRKFGQGISTESDWKDRLLRWYAANKRDLPWRRTREVYPVWVSEVMLQQTQVATALPYYERWMARFPTLESLATATEQDVLSIWQGLGYYRRAKLLRKGAQYVIDHGLPSTVEGWKKVPGIGAYSAAAIGSIALGLPAAAVDGNVERVFARFTANASSGAELLNSARAWSQAEIPERSSADWNQALMELGATVCTPRGPKCDECPLQDSCVARQTWTVDRYPAGVEAPATVAEVHTVWVPYRDGRFGLRQIPDGKWWSGMWEFPRVRAGDEAHLSQWLGSPWLESLGSVRHQVTQHKLLIEASLVRCDNEIETVHWYRLEALKELPMPTPQRKVLRMALQALGLRDDS